MFEIQMNLCSMFESVYQIMFMTKPCEITTYNLKSMSVIEENVLGFILRTYCNYGGKELKVKQKLQQNFQIIIFISNFYTHSFHLLSILAILTSLVDPPKAKA